MENNKIKPVKSRNSCIDMENNKIKPAKSRNSCTDMENNKIKPAKKSLQYCEHHGDFENIVCLEDPIDRTTTEVEDLDATLRTVSNYLDSKTSSGKSSKDETSELVIRLFRLLKPQAEIAKFNKYVKQIHDIESQVLEEKKRHNKVKEKLLQEKLEIGGRMLERIQYIRKYILDDESE